MSEAEFEVVTAVKKEISELPEDLQESGLALAAITLSYRLAEAGPRDTASIARELRTTLNELRERASLVPKEDDPLNAIQNRRANSDLSNGAS